MTPYQEFLKAFDAARRCATPLLAVQTMDPAAAINSMAKLIEDAPMVRWDIASGLTALNDKGQKLIISKIQDPAALTNPTEVLCTALKFPKDTAFFFLNGHRYVQGDDVKAASVAQAMWNLRDAYKSDERTLIITCPSIQFPAELKEDVIILDEPLPEDTDLKRIITNCYKNAKENVSTLPELKPAVLKQAIEAVRGLSAFTSEQVTAMSIEATGLNIDVLWERKRKTIEQTPGLQIWRGKETFADVRGVENMKQYLTCLFNGNEAPTVLIFMDEGEKMFAGSTGGDQSGVSQKMHGEFLTFMADNEISGLISVGHPGCSKSHITKATGGEFKVPTVVLNISALESKFIGESGSQLRNALKVILAIGKPFIMMTSNNLESLSPELRSRFTAGVFFFDLPTKEERDDIWTLYMKKRGLKDQPKPDDEGWTGREIKACCDQAYRLKISLIDASGFVVPVSRSAPERIESLRQKADKKFLNASSPGGVYVYNEQTVSKASVAPTQPQTQRKFRIASNEVGEA